jgi:hypothetical protein
VIDTQAEGQNRVKVSTLEMAEVHNIANQSFYMSLPEIYAK